MKTILRVKTGHYTLSKTVELPVPLDELKGIVDDAEALGEVEVKTKTYKKKGPQKKECKTTQRKNWTKTEIDKLERLYKNHTSMEIAKQIGRTFEAVKKRIATEGFSKREGKKSGPKPKKGKTRGRRSNWTKADVKYLVNNYKKQPTFMIAREIGKTEIQCRRKYGYERYEKGRK